MKLASGHDCVKCPSKKPLVTILGVIFKQLNTHQRLIIPPSYVISSLITGLKYQNLS